MMTHLAALTNEQLARSLMAGDPDTFKQGYTAENAVLAVQDYRNLTDDETRELLARITTDDA